MNIKQIIKYGIDELKKHKIIESNIKVKLLVAHCLNKNKEYLIAHDLEEITKQSEKGIMEGIERILNNEPIQYIIGYQEFMGLKFKVNSSVLIPRPDTEILVEEVLDFIKKNQVEKILDMCTGSGAIAVAIKKYSKSINIDAVDISETALAVANENAQANNVEVNFIKSDLFENVNEKYNIIVSNPPYIKSNIIKTLNKDVQMEPVLALDGGITGLDFYRKIIDEGYKCLQNDGMIFLEIGYDQKEEVIDIIKESNLYKNIYSKKDLSGNDRIIVCQKK